MTTQLAPTPVFKAFDNNGLPLANGLLYSYIAGTTTPQATYTDSTGNTPNTDPVVLNARGEANVWLNPAQGYKLVLTDSLGNQIWSVDGIIGPININQSLIPAADNTYSLGSPSAAWSQLYLGANHAPALNGGIIGYWPQTAAELAAGVTPVNYAYAVGDIRRYGGSTSLTDNSSAYAIAASVFILSGIPGQIKVGTGIYKFASGITLNVSYCELSGEQTTFDFSAVTSGDAVLVTGTVNPPYGQSTASVNSIKFIGNGDTGTVNGLHFYSATTGPGPANLTLRDVVITAFGTGELFDSNAYLISHFDCEIFACGNNVTTVAAPTNGGENINYHGGAIYNSPGYGVWVQGGSYDFHFYGTSIDGCGTPAGGGLLRVDAGQVHFHGHLESINGERAIYVPSTAGACFILFDGLIVQDAAGGTTPLIDIEGPGYLTLTGGRIIPASGTDTMINMAAGRFANWGCQYQYVAGTTPEVIAAGVNYVSAELNEAEFTVSYGITAGSVTSTNGLYDSSGNTVSLAAINTPATLTSNNAGGLLILSDHTLGGTAVFAVYASAAQSIYNGIADLAVSYSGADLQVEVTAGTVPRVLGWALIRTQA